MPIEVFLGGPVAYFHWPEDGAVGEGEHVAGHVLVGPNAHGNQDLEFFVHAHEAFVEGPVAETAKRQAVRGGVIMAFPPGFDVGCLHHRVQRVATKGPRSGEKFWGCSAFPKCRGAKALHG